jgi:enamine deaminase RidA (YjgF/YER057c/UK114 family)
MAQASAQTSAGRETPEDRLAAERIVLPPPPKPVGAYKPWAIAGSLLITSGQFPWRDGRLAYVGRIGGNILPPDAVGALSRIKQIVRVEGTMQVAPGFRDHPAALNGASDLVNRVFGERAGHSRMIYTNPEMPLDAPVLLVLMAEIET